jgi:aminopeptidase N
MFHRCFLLPAGCVLKMVQHFLSDDTFAKGLSAYLHRMEFRAVNPDDLYSSLHEVAITEGAIPAYLSIKEVMDSWANQKGFPFLTVERLPNGLLSVTQDRFLLRAWPTSEPQTWWVPFNMATKSSPDFDRTTPEGWIPEGTRTVTVRPSGAVTWDSDDWIVFNKQGSGYYRVNYDAQLWELVTQELVDGDFTQIHILNRAQLIDDAYNFARVMLVEYDVVLGLMEYLKHELEYTPWVSATRALTTIDRMIASFDYYDLFRTFVLNSVTPIFEKLGVRNIDNEPYLDRLARNVAVRWACYMGSDECQEATTDRIREYIATEQRFEADNRNTIMCAGMRDAGYDEGFGLWLKMQASTVTSTRYEIIDALVCSQNNELLQQLMGTLIVSLGVNYSSTEKTRLISGIANSGIVGTMAVMEFIETNMDEIDEITLGATVNNMASWISNQGTFMRVSIGTQNLPNIFVKKMFLFF